jgi:two-component system, cell cycle sensor histidine kinase and response regulator CckA
MEFNPSENMDKEDMRSGAELSSRGAVSSDSGALFFESWPDALLLCDESGGILSANPAAGRLFGAAPGALRARRISEFIQLPCGDVFRSGLWRADGGCSTFEIEGNLKEGEKTALEIRCQRQDDSSLILSCRPCSAAPAGTDEILREQALFHEILTKSRHVTYRQNMVTGNYDYISPSARDILGFGPAEIREMGFEKFKGRIHDADLLRLEDLFQKYYSDPEANRLPYIFEYRFLHKDGTWRWIADQCTQVRDAQGRLTAEIGFLTDISDRKEAEEALRVSEEKYRTIIEDIEDGFFEVDLAGNFTAFNDSLCRILGYTAEKMRGMNNRQYMRADTACRAYQVFNEVYRTGQPAYNRDWDLIARNGARHIVETTISLIRGDDGAAKGFRGITRDVTRRRETEERFRVFFDNSPAGLAVVDSRLRFVHVNSLIALVCGAVPEALIGQPVAGVIEKKHHHIIERIQHVIQTANPGLNIEIQGSHPERPEEEAWWLCSLFPMSSGGPEVSAVGVILADITQSRRAEQDRRRFEVRLQQAQKMESLGVLAGGIAHDFNNILMSVIGNAELAREMAPDAMADLIDEIEKAGRRAAALSTQMLTYTGQGAVVKTTCCINSLIESIRPLLRSSVSKKAQLLFRPGHPMARVHVDVSQMQQVTLNLVTNASEALEEKSGEIVITTSSGIFSAAELRSPWIMEELPSGEYVELTVQDTGCGIDPEDMGRIFDPFYTTRFMGRGLGLAAVLGVVRGHHASVRVESRPGRGTTVRILLPVHGQEAAGLFARTMGKERRMSGSPLILIADDEEAILQVTSRILKKHGFRSIMARNGEEAARIFADQAEEIDGAILDFSMPRMDGESALKAIREIRPDIPVVIASGYSEQALEDRFAGQPGVTFIHKPFRAARLMEKVRQVLPG